METCRSKEPANQLIGHIDSYLKDKNNQYAICILTDVLVSLFEHSHQR